MYRECLLSSHKVSRGRVQRVLGVYRMDVLNCSEKGRLEEEMGGRRGERRVAQGEQKKKADLMTCRKGT